VCPLGRVCECLTAALRGRELLPDCEAWGARQAVIRKCGAKQHKPKDDLTIIAVCIT
jgi:hypothetical protein